MSRAYGVVKPALLAAISETPRTGDELLAVLREQNQSVYVSVEGLQVQLRHLARLGLIKRNRASRPYRYSRQEGK